jgi:hypothetical protein
MHEKNPLVQVSRGASYKFRVNNEIPDSREKI